MSGKKLLSLILACMMLLALVIPAAAQDTTTTDETTDTAETVATPAPLVASTDLFVSSPFRVNVRSGPGIQYTVLGVMTPADSLDITGQNEAGTWLRVSFNGQEGWVFGDVVEASGLTDDVPVAQASGAAALQGADTDADSAETDSDAEVAEGPVSVITRFNTNLRSNASTTSDVLGVIPFEVELTPLARTPGGNWVQVTYEDQTGWIYAPILFFSSGVVESLPVVETGTDLAPTPAPEADTDDTGDTSTDDSATDAPSESTGAA